MAKCGILCKECEAVLEIDFRGSALYIHPCKTCLKLEHLKAVDETTIKNIEEMKLAFNLYTPQESDHENE